MTKYCAHLHHTLAAHLASLVASLPNSEQINHAFSNLTYTKSTPNHIYHHYAPFVTLTHTHTTHHLFNFTHIRTTWSPPDVWTYPAGITKLRVNTSGKNELPPLARVKGVGRQQQVPRALDIRFDVSRDCIVPNYTNCFFSSRVCEISVIP